MSVFASDLTEKATPAIFIKEEIDRSNDFFEADIAGQSIDFFTIKPESDLNYVINAFFLGSADVYSGMFPVSYSGLAAYFPSLFN